VSQVVYDFEKEQEKFRILLNRASRHYIIDFAMKAYIEILLLNAKVEELKKGPVKEGDNIPQDEINAPQEEAAQVEQEAQNDIK